MEKLTRRKIYDTLETWFWQCVDIKGPDDCWEWQRAKWKGYGTVSTTIDGKRNRFKCHRLAYSFKNGSIPKGLLVCHKCDNPSCVNPNHLFLGTPKQNSEDRNKKDRQAKGEKNHSKLKEEDIRKIRELKKTKTSREIGKQFGICHSVVLGICKKQKWKHVE